MNKVNDENIKTMICNCKYNVPESYNEKFNTTIEQLKIKTNRKQSKGMFNMSMPVDRKYIQVAVLALCVLVLGSVSTYAAISIYHQRMNEIPEKTVEKYNYDVQYNSDINADEYSRELTDKEKELMIELRRQYELGKFPQDNIKEIENVEEVISGELSFYSKESRFYLPDRMLSEEELLQIIDLQEKRDYSVRKQNNNEKNSINENNLCKNETVYKDIKTESVKDIAKLFQLDIDELQFVSSKQTDDTIECDISRGDILYEVSYSNGQLYRVICTNVNIPAHVTGVNLKQIDNKMIVKKLREQVAEFTDKEIETFKSYSMMDKVGNLATGTISMYCTMNDGSGCIAVYSSSYDQLYDIYTIEDAEIFKEMIAEKKQNAKRADRVYKLVK